MPRWSLACAVLAFCACRPEVMPEKGGAGGTGGPTATGGAGTGGAGGAGGSAAGPDAAASPNPLPPPAPGGSRLGRLRITPDNQVLFVDRGQVATQGFTVTLDRPGGRSEDVTARVMLASDNPAAGALTGASFRSAMRNTNGVEFTHLDTAYSEGGETVRGRANLTVVWLRTSGDQQDFFFTLPHNAPAESKQLSFKTLIQSLDVFFAVDTTLSMEGPITNLRDSLRNLIIPGVKQAAVMDAWFGVGAVEDFPAGGYGVAQVRPGAMDDQPFILLAPMTADVMAAQTAVNQLMNGARPRGDGLDLPEGQIEALYQIATGEGNVRAGVVNVPPHTGKGKGGVEFREGAQPVVVLVTDAAFHTRDEPGNPCNLNYQGAVAQVAHTRAQTVAALNKLCAKVIGVATGVGAPRMCGPVPDSTRFAVDTGTVVPPEAWDVPARPAGCAAGQCCTGQGGSGEPPDATGLCPLVFKTNFAGMGLNTQVISGITQVARFAAFDVVTENAGVTAASDGAPLPAGRTTADFLKAVTPLDSTTPPPPPAVRAPVIDGGRFTRVVPGTVVRFTVTARNDFIEPRTVPQVFRATIRIRAGGCADLDERDVIILVPPSAPVIE
jgi:hypothetical protein